MPKKAIIFDFDGVITNGVPYREEAYINVLRSIGISLSPDELSSYTGSTPQEVFTSVIERAGGNTASSMEDILKHYHTVLYELYELRSEPSPGLHEFIFACKAEGLLLGVSSSAPSDILKMVLRKFGIEGYIDATVGGEMVECPKPDAETFTKTIELLHVEPENAAAIDDRWAGIIAAKSLDMYTIAYLYYNQSNIFGADLNVYDFSEVDLKKIFAAE